MGRIGVFVKVGERFGRFREWGLSCLFVYHWPYLDLCLGGENFV